MFKIIVAFDKDRVIGFEGWMPWNLPEDLQHFKKVTEGHKLLMGKTTFKGLKKPLPNRTTYVLSSKKIAESKNVKWVENLDEFIKKHQDSEEVIFVCGGASVYKQLLPYTKEMIISEVSGKHKSDTYFPDFNEDDFEVKLEKTYDKFKVYTYIRKEDKDENN